MTNLGYPGLPPGHPSGTQWETADIRPCVLKDGRHILYTDATAKGNSGSPLYIIKEEQSHKKSRVSTFIHKTTTSKMSGRGKGRLVKNKSKSHKKAYVIGVHVGGSQDKENRAVPLALHMPIQTEFPS